VAARNTDTGEVFGHVQQVKNYYEKGEETKDNIRHFTK